jgi:hypothetical protein
MTVKPYDEKMAYTSLATSLRAASRFTTMANPIKPARAIEIPIPKPIMKKTKSKRVIKMAMVTRFMIASLSPQIAKSQ